MKRSKGQVIVEFALILPLFLLIMFGIIYSGMLFHDYVTVSNIARSGAREAAISGEPDSDDRYGSIESRYSKQLDQLLTKLYVKDGINPIVIEQDNTGNGVEAIINMKLNFGGTLVEMILPSSFGVKYYMRKEPTNPST